MSIYKKMKNVYWQIEEEINRLGLKTDGRGTLRLTVLAPEFNEDGEKLMGWFLGKKYEVYLHCCHIKNGYFSAKDSRNMLTLGFYVGS